MLRMPRWGIFVNYLAITDSLRRPQKQRIMLFHLFTAWHPFCDPLPRIRHQMKKKILIVEDNQELIKVLRLLLKKPYEVYLALNGEQGVAMATSKRPDLIIMDILLPEMDGLRATDVIRKNPTTRSIPILAVTASVNGNAKEERLQMGCNDFIAKPFTFEELLPRIEKLLPNHNGKDNSLTKIESCSP